MKFFVEVGQPFACVGKKIQMPKVSPTCPN